MINNRIFNQFKLKNNNDLRAKIVEEVKENLKLTIPLTIAQVSESLMLLIDILIMGFLGSEVLGAGSLGNMTIRFFLSVGICLACPVGIFIASATGNQKYGEIKTITAQGFFLIAIYTCLVILLLANEGTIISYFQPINQSMKDTLSYIHTVLYGFPAAMAFLLLQNVLISLGKPRIITITLMISVFLNAAFNYTFAFGKLGFPAMGLVGIALGTALVFWLQLIIVVGYIWRSPDIQIYQILNKLYIFKWQTFKNIIALGWPIGLQVMVEMGFLVLVGYIAGGLGEVQFSAFEAAEQAPMLLGLVFISIEQATTTRVAYNLGKNQHHILTIVGIVGIVLGVIFAMTVALIFFVKSHAILHFYIHPHSDFDLEVIEKSSRILKFIGIGQMCDALRIITCGALRGIKDTLYPLLIFCGCYAFLGLLLAFVTVNVFQWGIIALVATIIFISLLSGLILFKRFLTRTKDPMFLTFLINNQEQNLL